MESNHSECPNCKGFSFAETLADIQTQLHDLKDLLQEKKKSKTPMMNDEPRQSKLITPKSPSPLRQRAIALCVELDWLFKKSGNGGYDFRTANEAAYRFLAKLKQQKGAQAYLDRFLEWAWSQGRAWAGSLRVSATMFDFLQTCFDEHESRAIPAGNEQFEKTQLS